MLLVGERAVGLLELLQFLDRLIDKLRQTCVNLFSYRFYAVLGSFTALDSLALCDFSAADCVTEAAPGVEYVNYIRRINVGHNNVHSTVNYLVAVMNVAAKSLKSSSNLYNARESAVICFVLPKSRLLILTSVYVLADEICKSCGYNLIILTAHSMTEAVGMVIYILLFKILKHCFLGEKMRRKRCPAVLISRGKTLKCGGIEELALEVLNERETLI